jgi:hypothetical protein
VRRSPVQYSCISEHNAKHIRGRTCERKDSASRYRWEALRRVQDSRQNLEMGRLDFAYITPGPGIKENMIERTNMALLSEWSDITLWSSSDHNYLWTIAQGYPDLASDERKKHRPLSAIWRRRSIRGQCGQLWILIEWIPHVSPIIHRLLNAYCSDNFINQKQMIIFFEFATLWSSFMRAFRIYITSNIEIYGSFTELDFYLEQLGWPDWSSWQTNKWQLNSSGWLENHRGLKAPWNEKLKMPLDTCKGRDS